MDNENILLSSSESMSSSNSSSNSSGSNEDEHLTFEFLNEELESNSYVENMKKMLYDAWQQQQPESSSGRSRRNQRTGRPRRFIERNREEGHERLMKDYFVEAPTYTDEQFRRRFRMRRHLFLRIVSALQEHDTFFQMTNDALGRSGLSPLQKCTAAIRMLALGVAGDSVDEYVRLGASTAIVCIKKFVRGIVELFGQEYLRRPTNLDVQRLLQMGEARGFPGMLGSIDCMHWEWKNCPVAWKGMYTRGDHGRATIMLEAVASQDLWIWHAFFGTPGSNNDLNVLNRSPLFSRVLEGNAPQVEFTVNGTQYNLGYYLADGIYPEWATFVKTIPMPQGEKRKLFAQHQEGARKDVERAFGVLQSRFAIIRGPARAWELSTLKDIMMACVIMHNMIVEDEREDYAGQFDFSYEQHDDEIGEIFHGPIANFTDYISRNSQIHDRNSHRHLQADLVEHIWRLFGPIN